MANSLPRLFMTPLLVLEPASPASVGFMEPFLPIICIPRWGVVIHGLDFPKRRGRTHRISSRVKEYL